MEPLTTFLMVQDDVNFWVVFIDEKPHEETSIGVSSFPGKNRAGRFQETAAYPSQWNNHGMKVGW